MPRRPFAVPPLLAVPVLAAALVPVPAASASVDPAPAAVGAVPAPLVAGEHHVVGGEFVHNDFVYDDYGADTGASGQRQVVSLASTRGDVRYPDGHPYLDNAADIAEVRVGADGADLVVRVQFNTLVDARSTAVAVAWGTSASEVGDWEGTGVAVPHDGSDIVDGEEADVDLSANTFTFRLPGLATGAPVTLAVGAGLDDGAGGLVAPVADDDDSAPDRLTSGRFGPTDARLLDLAFNHRSVEPRAGAWQEDAQSADLQAGDVSRHVATIDLAADTGPFVPTGGPAGAFYNLLFSSRQTLGEGVAASFPHYRGLYQPYALWVPARYDDRAGPVPLHLHLHSLNVHHNQYRGAQTYEQFGNGWVDGYDSPGPALVATPLGRGPNGWYHDEGLIDTLEVWADVLGRFDVDRDHVRIGGYSMGGYGTYRLGTLMPDAFASAVSIVGPPVNGLWAWPLHPGFDGEYPPHNTYAQLENTRHIPFQITHGAFDELVPVGGVAHQADRFRELGHTYRFDLHPVADHLSFAVIDDYDREAAWYGRHGARETAPPRVTLQVRPDSWSSDGAEDRGEVLELLDALLEVVGARVDGAYWVGVVVVDIDGPPASPDHPDQVGIVDLTTDALGADGAPSEHLPSVGVDHAAPYLTRAQTRTDLGGPGGDRLHGSVAGITSLDVDLDRAGLTPDAEVAVTTDRPATLRLVSAGQVVRTLPLTP